MNDYNFFREDSSEKQKIEYCKKNVTIVIIVLVILLSILPVKDIIKIKTINKEMNNMEIILNSQDNVRKLNEIKNLKKQNEILGNYYKIVYSKDSLINNSKNVNSKLIIDISSTVPKDVYFKNININSSNINIQGIGESRRSIAELEYNLKNLNMFKKVHINNISEIENKKYVFNVKCILKDADNDESN